MPQPLSKARRKLLVRMECILGNECYNGSIQNYGPGGVREGDGRAFRYPLTVRSGKNEKAKVREVIIPATIPDESILCGHYAFGANQLDIMVGLNKIVDFLEHHYGFVLDTTSKT